MSRSLASVTLLGTHTLTSPNVPRRVFSLYSLPLSLCIVELSSAYPTTAGVHHWGYLLEPSSRKPFLTWMTGWLAVVSPVGIEGWRTQTLPFLLSYMHSKSDIPPIRIGLSSCRLPPHRPLPYTFRQSCPRTDPLYDLQIALTLGMLVMFHLGAATFGDSVLSPCSLVTFLICLSGEYLHDAGVLTFSHQPTNLCRDVQASALSGSQ